MKEGGNVWFKFRTNKRRKSGIVISFNNTHALIHCKKGGHYLVKLEDIEP